MRQAAGYLIVFLLLSGFAFAQTPDTLWTKMFGGDLDDHPYYVDHTDDNGFIVAGYSRSFGGGTKDIYIPNSVNCFSQSILMI